MDQPVTSVVTTPTPIVKPDIPAVTTPVETPTVASTVPEDLVPTLEADQIPERQTVPTEEFDWQRPSGANDPEVLQTPDLSISNPATGQTSPPTTN